ncbi:hypothetical protein ABZU86_10655 [Streptomyces sp. NPDC005271]|uniref:hypothetical protein n=1 Tax=unclassified Streptomyces TaxID=2593676 RepID=UPI0033B50575
MANPGFGKRSAPGQSPRRAHDFAHLPKREAAIAAYIDRLPDGAAIDAKTLAKSLPDYGQMACATALRRLSEAGHLRRVREHHITEDGARWVTRTFFSRTARGEEWWAAFLDGGEGAAADPDPRPAPAPLPVPGPARPPAYDALAALGRTDPRMTLSAADCARLEPLAAAWLARGVGPAQLVQALTAGLPAQVHSPAAIARTRLETKMPPEPPVAEPGPEIVVRRLLECTACGRPGPQAALPGGLCRACRGGDTAPAEPPTGPDVHSWAARLRAAARTRERSRA